TRVDRKKGISFLHVRAVLKMALDDLAGYLRLHLHGLVRCTCPDLIQVNWHILCDGFGYSRGGRGRLSGFNFGGPVLKDPVSDKRGQNDEKQVRPLRNPLIRSAGAFHLRAPRALGRAVIQCLNIAHFRVKFHFNPPSRREIALFLGIECRRLVWPLCSAKTRAACWRVLDSRRSPFSARSRIRASTLMHVWRSDSGIPANNSRRSFCAVALICAITPWTRRPSSTILHRRSCGELLRVIQLSLSSRCNKVTTLGSSTPSRRAISACVSASCAIERCSSVRHLAWLSPIGLRRSSSFCRHARAVPCSK